MSKWILPILFELGMAVAAVISIVLIAVGIVGLFTLLLGALNVYQ